MAKSIEEQVEDWCKNQLEKYFTKTESINSEIDEALKTAPSKKGGGGSKPSGYQMLCICRFQKHPCND